MAALSKVFQKVSLSLMKEQFSRLLHPISSGISSHFRLHGWRTDPGLETERLDIASFVVGSNKSLASLSRF